MLYKTRFIVLIVLFAFCFQCIIPVFAFSQNDFVIQVRYFEGKVEVQRGGKFIEMDSGMKLDLNDTIITGPESKVEIILDDGTLMNIKENSRIQLLQYARLSNDKRTIIQNFVGGVLFNVKKFTDKRSSLEVKTSSATAAIRGTIFSCEVFEDQTTKISVIDGTVAVNSVVNPREDDLKIKKNQKATILSNGEISKASLTPVEKSKLEEWQGRDMLQGSVEGTGTSSAGTAVASASSGGTGAVVTTTTILAIGGAIVATTAAIVSVVVSNKEVEHPKIPNPPNPPSP